MPATILPFRRPARHDERSTEPPQILTPSERAESERLMDETIRSLRAEGAAPTQ